MVSAAIYLPLSSPSQEQRSLLMRDNCVELIITWASFHCARSLKSPNRENKCADTIGAPVATTEVMYFQEEEQRCKHEAG
jgi:hypothetical protein